MPCKAYHRQQSPTCHHSSCPRDGYTRRRYLMLPFIFCSGNQDKLSSALAFHNAIHRYGPRRCPSNLRSINLQLAVSSNKINKRGLYAVNLEENEARDFHAGGNLSLIQPPPKKDKKNTSKKSAPYFWNDENDECIIVAGEESINRITKDNAGRKSLKFTIRGKPLPLVRHRSSQGFMYNPSGAAQEMFRDSLLRMLPQRHHPVIIDDGTSLHTPVTFFSKSEFLEMSILFRLKRPKSHFVGSKPGPGRIKRDAPGKFHVSRTDIDNLAKFVLDSLNGILYEDDRQVVSLKAMKMLDSEGMCGGATEVTITVLEDERVHST